MMEIDNSSNPFKGILFGLFISLMLWTLIIVSFDYVVK